MVSGEKQGEYCEIQNNPVVISVCENNVKDLKM